MTRRRGEQHLRRRSRRRRSAAELQPDRALLSTKLEAAAERSRRRWDGWAVQTWGDGNSTAHERRSRAAWIVRALELGGVARQRLLRSLAFDVAALAAFVAVVWIVAR